MSPSRTFEVLSDAEKMALGSVRFLCMDCRKDTDESQEYYMLEDALWQSLVPDIDGMLCLDCVERRLGRELSHADFSSVPVNAAQAVVCPALARRLGR